MENRPPFRSVVSGALSTVVLAVMMTLVPSPAGAAGANDLPITANTYYPGNGANIGAQANLVITGRAWAYGGNSVTRVRVGVQNLDTKRWLHPDRSLRSSWTRLDARIVSGEEVAVWRLPINRTLPPGRYAIGVRATDSAGNNEAPRDGIYHRITVGNGGGVPPQISSCNTYDYSRNLPRGGARVEYLAVPRANAYDLWLNGRVVRTVTTAGSNIVYYSGTDAAGAAHISVAPRNAYGAAPRTYCGNAFTSFPP